MYNYDAYLFKTLRASIKIHLTSRHRPINTCLFYHALNFGSSVYHDVPTYNYNAARLIRSTIAC